jgi:hypothetical protein
LDILDRRAADLETARRLLRRTIAVTENFENAADRAPSPGARALGGEDIGTDQGAPSAAWTVAEGALSAGRPGSRDVSADEGRGSPSVPSSRVR